MGLWGIRQRRLKNPGLMNKQLLHYLCMLLIYILPHPLWQNACQKWSIIQRFKPPTSEKLSHHHPPQPGGFLPPIGGRVSNFTFKPSPNMAYSVLFTAYLFRMLFGNSIGGLALFQCGVKRGTAVAKVRVKLTDSSRKQGLTDEMLMTWTMTHRLGIHHKHVSVLKHTWMQTNKRAPDLGGIVVPDYVGAVNCFDWQEGGS